MPPPVPAAASVERLGTLVTRLGESPVWCRDVNRLRLVDIDAGLLIDVDPDSGTAARWQAPGPVACLAATVGGAMLAGVGGDIWRVDLSSGAAGKLTSVELPAPAARFNDGSVDGSGRFWLGMMVRANDDAHGGLYRLGRTTPECVLSGLRTPNGLAFSADGACVYFSDSHPAVQKIWRADAAALRGWGDCELYFDTSSLAGRPDGAAIDDEGGYWFAAIDAGRLIRLDERGRISAEIAVPVRKPTKLAFGAAGDKRVYLTSMGHPRAGAVEAAPGALDGSVLRIDVGVSGAAQRVCSVHPPTPLESAAWTHR